MLAQGAAYQEAWAQFRRAPRHGLIAGAVLFLAAAVVNVVDFGLQPLNPYSSRALLAYLAFAIPWTLAVVVPLAAGVDLMMLAQLRGEPVPRVLDGYRVYGGVVGTYALMALIISAGFLLFVVPGWIFASRLLLAPLFAADQGMTPKAAIRASWTATRGHAWTLIAFLVVGLLVLIAGALLLIVGLIPAIAILMLARAQLYRMALFETAPPRGDETPHLQATRQAV